MCILTLLLTGVQNKTDHMPDINRTMSLSYSDFTMLSLYNSTHMPIAHSVVITNGLR